MAFYEHYGYFPKVVRHKCDNPPCINPQHLEAGTIADNNKDRKVRGRNGRIDGQRSGRAKLTDVQATEVRELYAAGGITQRELGEMYGITQSQVSKIVLGVAFSGKTKNSFYND